MDPNIFIHCPNLVDLKIVDNTKRYWLEEVFEARCRPALLKKLKYLDLNLDLYYGAQQGGVRHLEAVGRGQGEEAESAAEAEEEVGEDFSQGEALFPPLWTWDWYLPSLVHLVLTSEFAYRFEFRMLMGCPCLNALDLDITSEEDLDIISGDYGQHVRVITENDFFALADMKLCDGGDANSSSEAEEAGLQRIVSHSMRTLRLAGSWHITDNFLLPLLTGTFPELFTWTEQRWKGYSLIGLIHAIRTVEYPWFEVHVDLPEPSREEMVELGLITEGKRRVEEEKVGGGDGRGGGGRMEVLDTCVYFAAYTDVYKVLLAVDLSRRVEDVREESDSDPEY
ncbi:hypothetical protein BGZ96_012792 [Linnemannia gamsii]|uniref:F-box domain-containing protein n=1 Tax=Linnemannia gamsii TaxID=64522 RepID=A0ABQ7JQ70_9FUNG|nr:hypothetical protein BGZ96_012792 [Linnemannia gamsii]